MGLSRRPRRREFRQPTGPVMLKMFLASLAPLLLAVPLLMAFADDKPPRKVDAAGEVSTLLAAAQDGPPHHVRPRNEPRPPRHDL